jgi:hypothetical protein
MTLSSRTITPILGVVALTLFAVNFHRYLDHLGQKERIRHAFSDARHMQVHVWHGERGDFHHRRRLLIRPEQREQGLSFEIPPVDALQPGEPLRFEFEARRDSRNAQSETLIGERTTPTDI